MPVIIATAVLAVLAHCRSAAVVSSEHSRHFAIETAFESSKLITKHL